MPRCTGSTTTVTTPTGPKSSGTPRATAPASKGTARQAPSSFRRAVPTKRASTRTITPATIKTSRSRASTQTLTQKNVRGASASVSPEKAPAPAAAAEVDMSDAEGEMDAEGEVDLDAEGEDDVEGVFGMDQDLGDADAPGEEDVEDKAAGESAEEDEDDEMSTDESSYDYDDDKDGEFVLRSRSRSRPSTSRPARRPAGESASVKRGAGGRALRTRKTSGTGSASGRYNPYSMYSTEQGSGSPTTPTGSVHSIPGLRTLSSTFTGAGVNIPGAGDGVPSSPTLSASSSLSSAGDVGSVPKQRKTRPPTNLPVPVPVPNLTKKSRGRRVPTVSSLEELRKVASSQGESTSGSGANAGGGRGRRRAGTAAGSSGGGSGTKGARMYLCDVEGCGKCFARGEHLKRHVRSIHTNEKRESASSFLLLVLV